MTLSEQTQNLQSYLDIQDLNTIKDIDKVYQDLVDCIIEHNHRYYIQNTPIISDYEYDQLFSFLKRIEEELPQLISSNSPSQALIGQVSEGFEKAEHKTPLLSLENSYNSEDLQEFDNKVQKILTKGGIYKYFYIIEPKYDGLSVELIYKHGLFIQAITRGDGYIGDDITQNVKMIDNIPQKLNRDLSILRVRGEIMMPKSVLKQINESRESKGFEPFSNTRNAAAGSIKLLDSGEVKKRQLVCFVYDLLEAKDENNQKTEPDLKDLGFDQVDLPFGKQTIGGIKEICTDPETKKFLGSLDYDFDGLVIKLGDKSDEIKYYESRSVKDSLFSISNNNNSINAISLRALMGTTQHHPKRSIAYKFPAQQASTQILSIDFQVGRTGIITPVANLQPIQLSGVEISRVSLHNFDFISEKDIKLLDFVRIQRSGEVIPYVTNVIKDRRTGIETPISAPLFCPECNAPIINIQTHYYCTNPNCKAQLKEKIIHFCSKEAMDIQGIGDSIVDILIKQELIHNIADIYKISDIQTQIYLKKIPGFGEKKLSEIINQLEESKHKELWRIINALGIPNIGKKTAQDIAKFLSEKDANNLKEIEFILTSNSEVQNINGIGERTIIALKEFFANQQVKEMLIKLEESGVSFNAALENPNDVAHKGTSSEGMRFSITGIFPFPRESIKSLMKQNGYIFHDLPKKDTDFLLCGDKAGNKKEKAENLGIKIYDSRNEILGKFPFLLDITKCEKSESGKSNTPNQISLF